MTQGIVKAKLEALGTGSSPIPLAETPSLNFKPSRPSPIVVGKAAWGSLTWRSQRHETR